jgi:hypothetical protein
VRLRCNICGRLLKWDEFRDSLAQRGQLTYPSRRTDGSRVEFPVSALCGKCRQRAAQYRKESPTDPDGLAAPSQPLSVRRSRPSRASARRDRQMRLLLWGVLVLAVVGGGVLFVTRRGGSNRPAAENPATAPHREVAAPQRETASPVPEKRPTPRASVPPPTPTRLVVRVSDTSPRRARGFWITVVVPPAERTASAQAVVQFRDPRGRPFILTLKPSSRPGEWTRRSGLDEAGRWSGVAVLRGGKRKLTAPVPMIQVLP